MLYTTKSDICFDVTAAVASIIEAALKSLSTGALNGRTVLYLMNIAFTFGNLDSMS